MAEIPVEKKSATPWWLWLIAAVVLIALVWWAIEALDGPDEVALVAPAAQVAPAAPVAAGADITDPVVIVAVPDRRPLIGRTVRMTGIQVLDVIGDQAFWIGPDADRRVLVAMQEVPPPGSPTDDDININPGQTIDLIGQIRAMPPLTGADREAVDMMFGEAFARAAEDEQIYIFARAADVVARP